MMSLLVVPAFQISGYSLFVDNFYTGVALFEDLAKMGIAATGKLIIDRKGVPDGVKQLQVLSASNVPRGDGYYIREGSEGCVCVLARQTHCHSYVGHITWSW